MTITYGAVAVVGWELVLLLLRGLQQFTLFTSLRWGDTGAVRFPAQGAKLDL
jgi:hypothetical protein